jgi:hypothetical protein
MKLKFILLIFLLFIALISVSFAKKIIAGTITELTYHCKPDASNYYFPNCQNGLTGIFCNAITINNQGKLSCSDGGTPGTYYPFVDCEASYPSTDNAGQFTCFGKKEMTISSSAVSDDYIAFPIRWIVNDTDKGTSEIFGDCEFVTWGSSGQFVSSKTNARVGGVVTGGSARIPLAYLTSNDGRILEGSLYSLAKALDANDQSNIESLTIHKIVVGTCASGSDIAPGMSWSPEGIAYCEGKDFTPAAEIQIPDECIVTVPINPIVCSKDIIAPVTTASAIDANGLTYKFGRPSAADHIKVKLSCKDSDSGCPVSDCDKTYYCVDRNNTCNPDTNSELSQYTEDVVVTTTDNTAFAGGTYYIRYYSIDKAGNKENTNSQTLRLFQKGESVGGGPLFILSPTNNTKINTKTITVSAAVDISNLDRTEIQVLQNGKLINSIKTSDPLFSVDLEVPADGIYDITIIAYDTSGKTETQSVTNIDVNTSMIVTPPPTKTACKNNGVGCGADGECCSGQCKSKQCNSPIIQDGVIVPPAIGSSGFIQEDKEPTIEIETDRKISPLVSIFGWTKVKADTASSCIRGAQCAASSDCCSAPCSDGYCLCGMSACSSSGECCSGYCEDGQCKTAPTMSLFLLSKPLQGCAGLVEECLPGEGSCVAICGGLTILLLITAAGSGFVAWQRFAHPVPAIIAAVIPILIGLLMYTFVGIIAAIVMIAMFSHLKQGIAQQS